MKKRKEIKLELVNLGYDKINLSSFNILGLILIVFAIFDNNLFAGFLGLFMVLLNHFKITIIEKLK